MDTKASDHLSRSHDELSCLACACIDAQLQDGSPAASVRDETGSPNSPIELAQAIEDHRRTPSETCASSVILDGGDSKRIHRRIPPAREAPSDKADQSAFLGFGTGFNNDDWDAATSLPALHTDGVLLHVPNDEDPQGHLDEAIRRATHTSCGKDDLRFLPVDKLEELITHQTVYRELQRHSYFEPKTHEDLDSLTHAICDEVSPTATRSEALTTRKKIFATLVLIERVDAIEAFIQEGLYDIHLPVHLPNAHRDLRGSVYRMSMRDGGKEKIPINLFSSWKFFQREIFEQYQWQFLAPFFDMISEENPRPLRYALQHKRVLPFVEDYEGKGEVWRVRIHPAHHSHPSKTNPYFAVKRLLPTDRTEEIFKREVATLTRLSAQDHPHLMKLQLTYLWRDHYHLLFRWADGNLKKFWEGHPRPEDIPRTHGFATWAAQQLLGLTQGLQAIHLCPPDHQSISEQGEEEDAHASQRTRGRHGDLKPENILWFKQAHMKPVRQDEKQPHHQGTLVISDFGLTQFHRFETGRVNPREVARTPTYRPPEYDISDEITQSFDIWTWGCVLLEFAVWYLKGFHAWDGFSQERASEHKGGPIQEDSYFQVETKIGRDGQTSSATIKKSVVKQFATLHDDPKIPQFLVDLLDLIELKLLRMRPEHRATCDEIVKDLQDIYTECLRSEEYCVSPVPGSKPRRVGTDCSELSPRQPKREIFESGARDLDDHRRSAAEPQVLRDGPNPRGRRGNHPGKSVQFGSVNRSGPDTKESNDSPSSEVESTENDEEVQRSGSPKLEPAKPHAIDNVGRIPPNPEPGTKDFEKVPRKGRKWWRGLISFLCNIQD